MSKPKNDNENIGLPAVAQTRLVRLDSVSEARLRAVDWRCPAVECFHCDGLGIVAIGIEYWTTLRVLVAADGPMTTDQLTEHAAPTAVVTRLSRLEKMGLVKRLGKRGKSIIWAATLNDSIASNTQPQPTPL